MTKPIITKHGKDKLKDRRGLYKRAHLRHILKVLKKGIYLCRAFHW